MGNCNDLVLKFQKSSGTLADLGKANTTCAGTHVCLQVYAEIYDTHNIDSNRLAFPCSFEKLDFR